MGLLRITAKFPYLNGLTRDLAEHTWSFETAGADFTEGEATTALLNVQTFYNEPNSTPFAGSGRSIGWWMPEYIDKAHCSLEMQSVTLATGAGRGAPIEVPFVLDGLDQVSPGLPAEVALCLSFRGADTTARARNKGRVYLGPWAFPAMAAGGPDGIGGGTHQYSRPHNTLMANIGEAATILLASGHSGVGDGDPCPWVVWSRVDHQVRQVVTGWIDNEWDTQRRRGADATTRFLVSPL